MTEMKQAPISAFGNVRIYPALIKIGSERQSI